MKKQSFAVMLAAALSVGSLFPAALTVQAETDDNYEFLPRFMTRPTFLPMRKSPSFLTDWIP